MSDNEYDMEDWGDDNGGWGEDPNPDDPGSDVEIENNFYEAEG